MRIIVVAAFPMSFLSWMVGTLVDGPNPESLSIFTIPLMVTLFLGAGFLVLVSLYGVFYRLPKLAYYYYVHGDLGGISKYTPSDTSSNKVAQELQKINAEIKHRNMQDVKF